MGTIMTKKFQFATKPLNYDQTYYYWDPDGYYESFWSSDFLDFQRLRLHRIFLKEKYAKRADNFIKEFIRSNPEPLNYLTSAPEQGTEVWYGSYMTGDSDDPSSTNFDIDNKFLQDKLKDFKLYRTEEDVINAGNLINLALKTEYKRQKYKCITEEPEPHQFVYYPDLSSFSGVNNFWYDSNKPWHVLLFNRGMLFLKEEDAIRASKKMMQRINPLAMRTKT